MAKNQIVVVDIGTNTIKLIQLMQTGSEIRLISGGVEHYPRQNATEDIAPQTISQTLQQLWKKVHGRNLPVVLSIPRLLVASRRLQNLPATATDEQLQGLVAMQAENELPFRVEDVVHDYHDVSRTESGISVELIGARRDAVQKYIDYLKPIGVLPKAVLPSAIATGVLASAKLGLQETTRMTMVVDIGAGHTDVVLISGTTLKFSRSFLVGGNQLTLRYQNEDGGDFESAERKKIENATLAVNRPNATPAHEWAARLVLELERSIAAAKREININEEEETQIWLCGGGARVPGLVDYIEDRLGIPAQLWNPFDAFKEIGVDQASDFQSVDEFGDTLAVAFGLGINAFTQRVRLDLLPKEEKAKLTQAEKRRRLITAAAAGVVLIIGLTLGGLTWSRSYQAKVDVLDRQIRSIRRAESNAKKMLVKDTAIVNLLAPRISPLDILRELSVRFSDRTKVSWKSLNLTRLDEVDKAKITFNVEASSDQEISQMISIMAQSRLFTNIKSGQVTSAGKDKKQVFQAQITCNLAADASQTFAKVRHLQPAEESQNGDDSEEFTQAQDEEEQENTDRSDQEEDASRDDSTTSADDNQRTQEEQASSESTEETKETRERVVMPLEVEFEEGSADVIIEDVDDKDYDDKDDKDDIVMEKDDDDEDYDYDDDDDKDDIVIEKDDDDGEDR